MTNTEIVKKFYAVSAEADIDAMTELMSPEMSWTEMAGFPYGGTYTGKDQILEGVFAKLESEWEDFAVKPEDFYEAGDTVIATGYYSGTFKKTGKSFRARYAHVWKVEDNRLNVMEQFVDTLLVDRALRSD